LDAKRALFYLGEVVGSIAVATGKYLSSGSTIADFFVIVKEDRFG